MESFKRFAALLHARNIEFVRDRSALAWNILMPVLLVMGFAFLFSQGNGDQFKVAVLGMTPTQKVEELTSVSRFFSTRSIQFVRLESADTALKKLAHHQVDLVITVEGALRYWVNSDSSRGYMLERLLWGSDLDVSAHGPFAKQVVSGREIRYVDWVVPGILGMNMMFSCLFGIGYVIVRYRKNGVLKRFKATPTSALEFVAAQIVSRMTIIMVVTLFVFVACHWFISFVIVGSYLLLFFLFALGSFCMIALALIIAARTSSEELANGVLNLLSWPMLIFSGVWFSLDGLHPAAYYFAQLLPLTHLIDASRAIMNDGAGLQEIRYNVTSLIAMSAAFLVIGALTFKWDRR